MSWEDDHQVHIRKENEDQIHGYNPSQNYSPWDMIPGSQSPLPSHDATNNHKIVMSQGVASYAKLSESKAGKSLKYEGHG